MFTNALLTLGRLQVDAKDDEQATATYRRAIAHDGYLEEAHRELMRCLVRQGEHGLALQQYESIVRILQELGAPPSSETQKLVERLRRGEEM